MSEFGAIVTAGLNALGATGLYCSEEPCGCGLDDLMPCGEACPDCGPAYAVLCDGTNCEEGCEATTFPSVCFTPTSSFPDYNDSGEWIGGDGS